MEVSKEEAEATKKLKERIVQIFSDEPWAPDSFTFACMEAAAEIIAGFSAMSESTFGNYAAALLQAKRIDIGQLGFTRRVT